VYNFLDEKWKRYISGPRETLRPSRSLSASGNFQMEDIPFNEPLKTIARTVKIQKQQ